MARTKTTPLVLLVDDVRADRVAYAEFFRFAGLRVKVAATAEEGLAMALVEAPAVVVFDLSLGGMDGWEAARRLKANAQTKDVRTVLMTPGTDEQRARAIDAGVDTLCEKPCLPIDLLKHVLPLMPREDGSPAPRPRSRTRRRE